MPIELRRARRHPVGTAAHVLGRGLVPRFSTGDLTGWFWTGLIERIGPEQESRDAERSEG